MWNPRSKQSLSFKYLHELFLAKLGNKVSNSSDTDSKPLFIELRKPWLIKIRLYLFNCCNPPGGRPSDEYKINLNIGQEYGEKAIFDYSEGCFPIIAGYVQQFDVFVFWDATKHHRCSFNKNLQVKVSTLLNAIANPLATQERRTRQGIETIIACRGEFITEALLKRIDLIYNEVVKNDNAK